MNSGLNKILFVAGFGFFILAFVVVGVLPWVMSSDVEPPEEYKQYVRPYTDAEARGRQIYIREVCWHCHTQFVRPVRGEVRRYGPVSRYWEYAYDLPQLLGTRRVGPDLAREGGLRSDDWHRAHFRNPQAIVPVSVMPKYTWLTDQEIADLTAYVQRLGTTIGDWRSAALQAGEAAEVARVTTVSLTQGQRLYEQRCAGCHGTAGDGEGPAAAALEPKPRNFKSGVWKYGSTDEEIFQSITNGIAGSAMPPWSTLPEQDRWALVFYVKTFQLPEEEREEFLEKGMIEVPEADESQTSEATLPGATAARLALGKEVYEKFCAGCHGIGGKGNGPAAAALDPKPRNFTGDPQWKLGGSPEQLFNTITHGIAGSAMPGWGSLSEEERWAVTYYVLKFSEEQ